MTDATWRTAIESKGVSGGSRTLVTEARRTRFPGDLPTGFEFPQPFVGLDFLYLGQPDKEFDRGYNQTPRATPGQGRVQPTVQPDVLGARKVEGDEGAKSPKVQEIEGDWDQK
jgi:hypothetical protein